MKNADLPAMPIGEQTDVMHSNAPCNGLTKREYFAMMALQGLLASGCVGHITVPDLHETALRHANHLLEELERTE